jgi:FtsP/CotA-like multicopper oxidase with cupredoxin domain
LRRAAIVLLALFVAQVLAAQTAPPNSIPCIATSQELNPLPEAKSDPATGILSATMRTEAVQVRMTTGVFGTNPTPATAPMGSPCYPQWVRQYRLGPTTGSSNVLEEPTPGPVFRARVGDLVELTFLNLIDRNKFPNSDKGCDKTSTYPGQKMNTGNTNVPDKYPDCFALSTWTNVHYHGTHTNPGSTGDNVFLEIQPSARSNDAARTPSVNSALVAGPFKDFFTRCESELAVNNVPKQWPRFWGDLPDSTRSLLQTLVQTSAPDLWAKDEEQIKQGAWPQYYVGAYPYCFRLPKYTPATWPPAPTAVTDSPHTAGAGSHEHDEAKQPNRPLIMGQAPGTHWYHAHKHGSTTINVNNGMTGVFIIEDPDPKGYDGWFTEQYKKYGGLQQKLLVIQELSNTPSLERGGGGGPGPHFSVNGRLQPKITMKGGEVQLWRIANNSARSGIYFVKPTAINWKQTAQDGVQFDNTNYTSQENDSAAITLTSGNRADLLVKAPMLPPGAKTATYKVAVMNTVDKTDLPPYAENAKSETLLTVVVNANGTDMPFMGSAAPMPPYLQTIADDEVKGTKTLTFASTAPGAAAGVTGVPIASAPAQHTIDGKKFDGEIGAAVRLNKVEEWKLINETYVPNQISHPFHIHINPFQISAKFDPNAVLSSTPGPEKATVTMAAKSTTVTVTGATFDGVQAGDFIWINGLAPSTVLTVGSDKTSLTVNNAAGQNGITEATYRTAIPQYTINASTARKGQCVINPNDDTTWEPCFESEPPAGRIWWDVFPIPSGNIFYGGTDGTTQYKVSGWFKMRSRFVDYAGHFVMHCHILAHEDRGMMTVVEVSPLQPPYSHH